MIYRNYLKRPLDAILSLISLILLSPLLLLISILVRIKLGKPILFTQKRPGLNEKIFTIYKFRTMTNEKDKTGKLLPDTKRLTKFGKFLRSTSLDELPELYNILKGDMSFVGPRPLRVEYLTLYNNEQRKRHLVRPGLSGLAQINGRNTINWEDKFAYDITYINSISCLQDLSIIINTILITLKRQGINQSKEETMKPFNGQDI